MPIGLLLRATDGLSVGADSTAGKKEAAAANTYMRPGDLPVRL
jgi:hypothetical protein